MRIAFCGTPEFALPSLQLLIDRGYKLCVFTQPDRPKGRGKAMQSPPVCELAKKHGIPVFQFEKIRRSEGLQALREFAPDLMVTAAFGQILSAENLSIPKLGCINVHGSLLPKYRGASPVQSAVIDGASITGVTTMLTDIGLDTGDMLLSRKVTVGENETAGELYIRLADVGAELLGETIDALLSGTLERTPQDDSKATKCGLITKESAKIDFSRTSSSIHNLVRGMNPAPIAWALFGDDVIKIHATRLCPEFNCEGFDSTQPGDVLLANSRKGLFVTTGDGAIEITKLQAFGSKQMEAKAFLNGRKLDGGSFR